MFEDEKNYDSKSRNSMDLPITDERIPHRKSTEGAMSCFFPESESQRGGVVQRKWSTNDQETAASSYQSNEQLLRTVFNCRPKRSNQNYAKELEDDVDSISSQPNLFEEINEDNGDDYMDPELRQNLERIIGNDFI